MQTIEWVKAHELSTGGVEAWDGLGKPYPEVTGYLIPTLLDYGEKELAERLGDWLESIQNSDGSFDGLDGIPHAFDTGACYEGLKALNRPAADKALAWLETQFHDGYLRVHPSTTETHFYNIRVLGLMGKKEYKPIDMRNGRTHYLAYALEGMYNMGVDITEQLNEYKDRKSLLTMFIGNTGSDTCATAQMAVLCLKNNIPCDGLINAVRAQVDTDGGVFHDSGDRRKCSWTAKYYLDMEFLCQKAMQSSEPQKDTSESKKKARRKSG